MCSLISTTSSPSTAPEFQAILTISFFVDFTQRILIEGFDLILHSEQYQCDKSVTSWSSHKRRHITQVQDKTCMKTHSRGLSLHTHSFRPWGLRLPISCEKCGCTPTLGGRDEPEFHLCLYCRGKQCSGEFRRTRASWIDRNETKGGHWMEKQITILMYLCSCTSSAC